MTNKTATTKNFIAIHPLLHFGRWAFTPRWIPSLAALLLLPLLLSLGFWQLHRAAEKQKALDQFAARSQQTPQPLSGNEPVYTPVTVNGHYDNTHIILLDNRIVNHRAGYDVLAPFIPSDNKPAVLINLGWIPREENIAQLTLPPEERQLTGLVQTPQHNFVLAHPKSELRWPLIIEDIQIAELSKILNTPLSPFVVLLTGPGGFIPHWGAIASVSPQRHRGYAVQWFALALTLVIIYFKLNIRRYPHE